MEGKGMVDDDDVDDVHGMELSVQIPRPFVFFFA